MKGDFGENTSTFTEKQTKKQLGQDRGGEKVTTKKEKHK